MLQNVLKGYNIKITVQKCISLALQQNIVVYPTRNVPSAECDIYSSIALLWWCIHTSLDLLLRLEVFFFKLERYWIFNRYSHSELH